MIVGEGLGAYFLNTGPCSRTDPDSQTCLRTGRNLDPHKCDFVTSQGLGLIRGHEPVPPQAARHPEHTQQQTSSQLPAQASTGQHDQRSCRSPQPR